MTRLSAQAYRLCVKRSKKEVLDADFAAARAGVLDVAAFLDRVDRGEGEADFRYRALLEALSYRDDAVPETAAAKAACGAPNLSK